MPWAHLSESEHQYEESECRVEQVQGLAIRMVDVEITVHPIDQPVQILRERLLLKFCIATENVRLPEDLRLDQLKVLKAREHIVFVPTRMYCKSKPSAQLNEFEPIQPLPLVVDHDLTIDWQAELELVAALYAHTIFNFDHRKCLPIEHIRIQFEIDLDVGNGDGTLIVIPLRLRSHLNNLLPFKRRV